MRILGGGPVFPGMPVYATTQRFAFRLQIERDDDVMLFQRENIVTLETTAESLRVMMETMERTIREGAKP